MNIIPVTAANEKAFYALPKIIYKNDPNWIQPLDKDVQEVFNPKKNKSFGFGEVVRWIAQIDGKTVGRIAAFTNSKYKNKGDDVPVGGIGFFECINDKQVSFLLLEEAKNWLSAKGMEAMDGPINFGERDKFWGLVTKGYQPPLYGMNYNPPYYVELFEAYGFKIFYNQICFGLKSKEPLDEEKVWKRHKVIAADPNFSSDYGKKDNLEKYATDFATVYNAAWAGHGGLKQLSPKQVLLMFKRMKPIMDERLLFYAYYKNEPVAIFINLPDLNQWFKYLHGKFSLFHKLKFLFVKKFVKNTKFTGLVFGVVPEWQGKGVDGYIIGESALQYLQQPICPYSDYEMQWIGDFNPKMINVASNLGNVFKSRELSTFRYLFDTNKEFVRHPIL
jgi:hypothetical protein